MKWLLLLVHLSAGHVSADLTAVYRYRRQMLSYESALKTFLRSRRHGRGAPVRTFAIAKNGLRAIISLIRNQ